MNLTEVLMDIGKAAGESRKALVWSRMDISFHKEKWGEVLAAANILSGMELTPMETRKLHYVSKKAAEYLVAERAFG